MKSIRDLAKTIIIATFGIRESYFESAWDILITHIEKQSSNVADSTLYYRRLIGPLGIQGEDSHNALLAILIFADSSMRVQHLNDKAAILDAIRSASRRYEAHNRLTNDILNAVKRLLPSVTDPGKKDLQSNTPYARLWTEKSQEDGIPIDILRAEELKKAPRKYDLFIYDTGQFRRNSGKGLVCVRGIPISNRMLHSADGISTQYPKSFRFLTKLQYRVLFYTFQNRGHGCGISSLMRYCWLNTEIADSIDKDPLGKDIKSASGTIRRMVVGLNKVLRQVSEIEILSSQQNLSVYGCTSFGLIEIT